MTMSSVSEYKPVSDRVPADNTEVPLVLRTINLPFLIGSVLVFAILAGIIYQVRVWQVGRTSVALLQRADELEREEKWSDAAENIQRYVQLMPLADWERVRLALVYEKGVQNRAEREKAIALFYRAIGTGLQNQQHMLRQKLTRLLLQNQRYFEARSEAEKLLSAVPEDAEALEMRAIALWGQWQSKSFAREDINRQAETVGEEGTNTIIVALEHARKENPSNVELAVALAEAYRDRELKAFDKVMQSHSAGENVPELDEGKRIDRADQCMAQLIESSQDPQAFLACYAYRMKWHLKGTPAEVEKTLRSAANDIEEAIGLAPKNKEVLLVAGNAARYEGQRLRRSQAPSEDVEAQFKRARDLYQKCLDLDAREGFARLSLGEMCLALDEPEKAVELWKQGLKWHKSQPIALDFQIRLAEAWLDEGKLADAEKMLNEIKPAIDSLPQYVPPDTMLVVNLNQDLRWGVLYFKRGQPARAIPFLKQVVVRQEQVGGKSEQSIRALLLLGSAHAAINEWIRSAEAFDQAALQAPDLAMAHSGASSSWLAANDIESAIERGEQAVRQESTCRSWLALARALLQQQIRLPAGDRVWSRLDEAMLEAQQRAGDGTLADAWQVDLLAADCVLAHEDTTQAVQERHDKAVALLKSAAEKYPMARGLWETLPLVYQRIGKQTEADQSCDHLASLAAGAEAAASLRVRLLSLRGQHRAAEEQLLRATRGPGGLDTAAAQRELINVRLAQKDLAGARKLLIDSAQKNPIDVYLLRRLADIDLEARQLENVQKWEAAMEQEACGPLGQALALYFRIRRALLAAKSTSEPAFEAMVEDHARLLKLRSHWHEAVALGGLIEETRNRLEETRHYDEKAILAYERAIALGDQRLAVYERLISLLERNNRSADAEKYLSRLDSSVSLSQDLTVFESTLELRRNQLDEAVEVARNGVRQRPQDAAAHTWLGRMLLHRKLDDEAETAFRKAVELQASDIRPWSALFDFYIRLGRKDQARQLLTEVSTKVPLKDLSFFLAQSHEVLGDREQAAAAYVKALESAPKNPAILMRMAAFHRADDIEKSVQLAKTAFDLEPESVTIRRNYAAILGERGSDSDWREIDRLLSSAASDATSAAADNRFQAILLARRGGARNLVQSVRILEELQARPESQSDGDRLLLSQLYERVARLAETPEGAQSLQQKAYEWIVPLGDRPTPQAAHLKALVEFSLRHHQPEDATRWLAKFAELLDPTNKPTAGIQAEFVRLALAHGDTKQAEEQLTELEGAQPDALTCIALRAQLLEKQGKSSEIHDIIEAAAGRLLPKATRHEEKTGVCQGIGDLYTSLKLLPEAETWYRRLTEFSPNQFQRLVAVVAEQGRIGDALEICRTQSEGKNVLPAALSATGVLAGGKATERELAAGEALIATARQQFPKNLQLLSAVATLRVTQGRTDDAVTLFEQLVQLDGRDPLVLNNLATMLAEIEGRRDDALKHIDNALRIAGREPSLLDTKGTILLFKGDVAGAVSNLEAAAREPDADPRYRFHLALAYRDLNRTDEARAELQRAFARDLERQILTMNERKLLSELRAQLSL
jgi:tetratricopeptide (TPR) repeat protein